MAKDNKKEEEEILTEEEQIQADRIKDALHSSDPYERMAEEAPPRLVDIPSVVVNENTQQQEGEGAPTPTPTLSQALQDSSDLTDMQASLARMFPKNIDIDSVMVARIDPQIFLSSIHLASNDEIMRSDPRKSINVNAIIFKNYTRFSIGLDGEGRVDVALLAGAAREEKRIRNALGRLGSSLAS